MIARHDGIMDKTNLWAALAAPLDGPVTVDAVLARLDATVAGEWDFTIDLLPAINSGDGVTAAAFKARMQILGVIREGIGMGRNYKTAAGEALLAAASCFRIGAERATTTPQTPAQTPAPAPGPCAPQHAAQVVPTPASASPRAVACPVCGGPTFSNVAENDVRAARGEKLRPDYRCRDRSCVGVIWRPRERVTTDAPVTDAPTAAALRTPATIVADFAPLDETDPLPF